VVGATDKYNNYFIESGTSVGCDQPHKGSDCPIFPYTNFSSGPTDTTVNESDHTEYTLVSGAYYVYKSFHNGNNRWRSQWYNPGQAVTGVDSAWVDLIPAPSTGFVGQPTLPYVAAGAETNDRNNINFHSITFGSAYFLQNNVWTAWGCDPTVEPWHTGDGRIVICDNSTSHWTTYYNNNNLGVER